jgi:methyl-accepting chemotaxis protein
VAQLYVGDAATGGGEIIVDKAAGLVTARNLAGHVQVGAAAGVSCESHSGGIRVNNIAGAMRVSTSAGSIFASLLNPARLTDSLLTTGNGDITVVIPSNVGVNVRAVNAMTDNMRRIVSDFRQVQARLRGAALVAEGSVNGGGPLLEINGRGGTIFIKRQ